MSRTVRPMHPMYKNRNSETATLAEMTQDKRYIEATKKEKKKQDQTNRVSAPVHVGESLATPSP